jgi:molybdate transport system substrate-binding protein
VAMASVLVAGCGQQPQAEVGEPPAAEQAKISALVPCGQVGPFSEAVKAFERNHPGVKVDWVPENIVTMTKKVLDGKDKPDVFLSMGDLEMDQIEQAGLLVEGTRARIAENALAITVPAENRAGVTTLEDLAKPAVQSIAIPDPATNSVGIHAKEALQKAGLWEKVQAKVIMPRFAADGKEVAAQGRVDASIGYYPCVVEVHVEGQEPAVPKGLKLASVIPGDLYEPFWCEAAVIKGAGNPEGGTSLIEFLKTPEVQEIYRKWSFVREAPASAD